MGQPASKVLKEYMLVIANAELSQFTKTNYKSQLRQFLYWTEENCIEDLKAIGPYELRLFLEYRRNVNGCGKGVLRLQHIVLTKFFQWAKREGYVKKNPMKRVDRPIYHMPKVQFPEENSIDKVIEYSHGDVFIDIRDEFILTAFKETGARARELLRTEEHDWNVKERVVHIRFGKGSKERTVPFGEATEKALIRYKEVRKNHPFAHMDKFILGQNGELQYTGLRLRLIKRCSDAGVEYTKCHGLRHAFVHRAKSRGMSSDALQELAGWDSPTMEHHYALSMREARAITEYRSKMDQG